MIWLLDFSDTLASGSKTWAFEYAFPTIIAEHHLPVDEVAFRDATLFAQKRARETDDESLVLTELFVRLNWPDHLKPELTRRIFEECAAELYEDTLPFLERLRQASQTVYVVSNTNDTAQLLDQFGLTHYFQEIVTPERSGGLPGKPSRAMWDYLVSQAGDAPLDSAIVVGDDPWSDGAFAEACGLQCWIIDRTGRLESLYDTMPFGWARSLLDIPFE